MSNSSRAEMSGFELERRLLEAWPRAKWHSTRQLIAVSGGADSVALLRALTACTTQPGLLSVAHFNHGWRGKDSDADEDFVRQLCNELGVSCCIGRCDRTSAPARRSGSEPLRSEENARQLRYNFLIRTAYDQGARYVLTAHTASDRVETLLHNLFRGTGLAGVATPTLTRPLDRDLVLARPLLGCERELVEDYLLRLGQAYRIDASNADVSYRRNYLRHRLLPLLRREYGSNVDAKLLSFSQLAEEALGALQEMADDYLQQVERLELNMHMGASIEFASDGISLPTRIQLPARWPVVREALKRLWIERCWSLQSMTRNHWEQIHLAWSGADEQFNLPGGLRLVVVQGWLHVR